MKKGFLFTKVFILSLVLLFGLTACGGEKAGDKKEADNGTTTEENKDDGAKEPLIVGTEAGFAPFEYVGENGEVVGVDIEIAQAIADKLGRELQIKNMSFDGALLEVQSGKIDLVAAGVNITEERKKKMDFSEPYYKSSQVAVVNAETPAITNIKEGAFEGKILGAQLGTTADIWATENAKAAEVRTYKQLAVAITDLQQNKIDAIIIDDIVANEMVASTDGTVKVLDGKIIEEETALALPKDSELMPVVNEVIKEMKEEGKIDELFKKHKKAE